CASAEVLSVAEKLRELGQVLGRARDWDVFLAGAVAKMVASLPEERSIDRLLRAARRRRARAYRRLIDHLSGPDFRRLAIALAALGAGSSWRNSLDEKQRAA